MPPLEYSASEHICRAYDGRPDRTRKPPLSRAAQGGDFALWVFACGAVGALFATPRFETAAAPPGGRMHRLLTTLGRGFKERIGWKRLGIAASLLIIAFAITTMVRTLKGVDTGVILTALTEIPPGHIGLAALCVLGAFCTLTFYYFFSPRALCKQKIPLPPPA